MTAPAYSTQGNGEDILEGAAKPAPSPFSGQGGAQDQAATPAVSEFPGLGPLLEQTDPAAIVDAIVQEVQNQAPARKRRRTENEAARLWAKGVRGARVRQSEDRNNVELVIPLGALDAPPVMGRTKELLEKYVSHLLSDPAIPDAQPASDTDQDRDAAEFVTRLLTVEGAESGYNNAGVMRRAAKKSCVFKSAFIYQCVDPMGGGWRAKQVQAHPDATMAADALMDPATNQPADPSKLVKRFVRGDGTLSQKSSDASRQWLPKLKPEVLTSENVVLLPETATGINDADGMIIIRFTSLGKLKGSFAKAMEGLSDTAIREMADWKPEEARRAAPGVVKGTTIIEGPDGALADSTLICTLTLYYTSHGPYPKGAYIVVAGPNVVLHKQTWSGMVEQPDGSLEEECLELPAAQIRLLDDEVDDDHMGRALINEIAPGDDVRGEIELAWREHLDKVLSPNTYLPMGSIIQPEEVEARDGRVLYFNPQGTPVLEEVADFPADGKEFYDRATRAQDSAIMLEETAQAANVSSVTSGVQVQAIAGLANQNIASSRANLGDAQQRLWRISAQLIRVFYTIPLQMKYESEDGSYKQREWTRADLGSTRDISIAAGSFTQQSPQQKQAQLDQRLQMGAIDVDEHERLSANNLKASIGYQDNPHRQRVRRQISAWREGPPKDAAQQQKQFQRAVAQYQAATQAPAPPAPGQPPQSAPPSPPPVPPVDPLDPFGDIRPVDDEQDVAVIRHKELRREMAGGVYVKWPTWWSAYFSKAYDRAKKAAGVATLAEQQQIAASKQQPPQPVAGSPEALYGQFVQNIVDDVKKQVDVLMAKAVTTQVMGGSAAAGAVAAATPPAPPLAPPGPTPEQAAEAKTERTLHLVQAAGEVRQRQHEIQLEQMKARNQLATQPPAAAPTPSGPPVARPQPQPV